MCTLSFFVTQFCYICLMSNKVFCLQVPNTGIRPLQFSKAPTIEDTEAVINLISVRSIALRLSYWLAER